MFQLHKIAMLGEADSWERGIDFLLMEIPVGL
jgi:hypothetical protein